MQGGQGETLERYVEELQACTDGPAQGPEERDRKAERLGVEFGLYDNYLVLLGVGKAPVAEALSGLGYSSQGSYFLRPDGLARAQVLDKEFLPLFTALPDGRAGTYRATATLHPSSLEIPQEEHALP